MRSQTLAATQECAGNGRCAFDPPAEANSGSAAEWTGVPLAEILAEHPKSGRPAPDRL